MKIRALASIVLAVLLPLTASACGNSDSGSGSGGGNSTQSPALKDLSKQLQQGGMPKAQADCMAKSLGEAGISDADIAKLKTGDTSGLDSATFKRYTKSVASCLSAANAGN